ncbi:MAG: alpha/beta hydrolase, partial [Gammaproteobacteria bacterium]
PYYDDLTELPPTTIIVGEYDGLRGDREIYAKKLIASGVIVEKIICEGQVHNSLLCRKVLEEGPDQAILAGKCLKVHLKEL